MVVKRLALPSLVLVALLVWSGLAGAAAPKGAKGDSGAKSAAKSAAKMGVNLLRNPGFEEAIKGHPWMPAGWDTSRADMPSVFFGRDTVDAHGGHYAVSVANGSGVIPLSHNWSQSLIIDRSWWGKDMVFSVWTKSAGVEGRAYIKLEAYRDTISKMAKTWGVARDEAARRLGINAIDDPLFDLAWKRQFFTDEETPWTRRQVRVFIPPTSNILFVRCGLVGTGQLSIDDASLTLEPAEPAQDLPLNTNLLADPGFEGNGNDWEYSLPPYPDMAAMRDTVVRHSGQASIRFTSLGAGLVQGKAGACQVFSNRSFANKRVRFSAFVKTDSLKSSTAYIKVYTQGVSGVEQNAGTQVFSGTMDWGPASVDVDIPADTYEIWVWLSYTAPAPGTVWFDDASLTVLGPAGTQ